MDVKCRKCDCTHNDCRVCLVKNLDIKKDAECASYERNAKQLKENKNSVNDASYKLFGGPAESIPYQHVKRKKVICRATTCIFNVDKHCDANGLNVCVDEDTPYCSTYLKK